MGLKSVRTAGPKVTFDGLNTLVHFDAGNRQSFVAGSTTWTNISKTGVYNATLVNGPTFSAEGGGSIVLDATDDSFSFPTAIPIAANSDYTFCAFIKPTSIDTGGGGSGLWRYLDSHWLVFQDNTNRPWVRWGGNDILKPLSGYGLTLSKWVHVAFVVRSATNVQFYADGVLEHSANHATATTAASIAYLGYQFSTAYQVSGNYAIVQMYKRALSSTEVFRNFSAHRSRFGV
jgi:hypothetical protein